MTTVRKQPLREQFEMERRRAAFLSFLAGAGAGIIVADMWVSHWLGVPGGLAIGGLAYAVVWTYETLMWRREHG